MDFESTPIVRLTHVDVLIFKMRKEKNSYVRENLCKWLDSSDKYVEMMQERTGRVDRDSYWYFKTLYMYNKICPNLKHDLEKPTKSSTPEYLFDYEHENSQVFGLTYTENDYLSLEDFSESL